MTSRLIMDGLDNNKFGPDTYISRGEFVASIIKGLGLLRKGTGYDIFKDVKSTNPNYDAIKIAYEYKIALGCGNGIFRPSEKITREEAMLILFRAMKLAKINTNITDIEITKILSSYKDKNEINSSSMGTIAICIRENILEGNGKTILGLKQNITRAQTAVVIKRLLQKSKLI